MEIFQLMLADMFANPGALYERLVSRKGYIRNTHVEFDGELLSTGWTSMGCALFCVLVHHRREAFLIMLSSEDLSAMRESLAEIQVSLNTTELLKAGRTDSPFGFGR